MAAKAIRALMEAQKFAEFWVASPENSDSGSDGEPNKWSKSKIDRVFTIVVIERLFCRLNALKMIYINNYH